MGPSVVFTSCILVLLAVLRVTKASDISEINIPEDGRLNFTQLAEKYYKPCQQYEVTTEDGYILTIFRLNGGNNNGSLPILLTHGVLDSSDVFVLRGVNSTGIALASAGHDVWFANIRGNKYCRRHVSLDPVKDKYKFWDFSFHEFGYYDLAATIDFILKETGHKKISAVGYCQGSSQLYILGSLRPEYNDKIQIAISMAPVAYLNNLRGLLAAIAPLWPLVSLAFTVTGSPAIFQDESSTNQVYQLICSLGKVGEGLCKDGALMAIAGDDSEELESEFYKVTLGHFPAGSARKNGDHYYQVVKRKRFGQFDYGALRNRQLYGSEHPPDYDLSKVTMPMAILVGQNDNFSTLKDVEQVKQNLGNVVYYKVMDRKQFNHLDFVVARNINVYVNPLLKSMLEQYGQATSL